MLKIKPLISAPTFPLPSNAIIGILGGGQLGRMIAMAAARLGYRCHIFCPEMDAPALQVTPLHTAGNFTDYDALARFAASVDVITLEWENVPLATLEFLAQTRSVCPSASVLAVAQDRIAEKEFANKNSIATASFRSVGSAKELHTIIEDFPLPAVLKSNRMGYDGKGQVLLRSREDCDSAWQTMGGENGILESFVKFEAEISVIIARRAGGVTASYPPVHNIHRNHILAETHAPAQLAPEVVAEACAAAELLATKLDVVGLLAVEMFVLPYPDAMGRRILVNEIAPRPHNSGHWTIDACACSQFEQLVRAICGLPLGDTTPHSRAVMYNLLGEDVSGDAGAAKIAELLATPNTCVHLYGKTDARPGRKMGHATRLIEKM